MISPVPEIQSERAVAAARLWRLASWCIPLLTTVLTVMFFYLLSGRAPWLLQSAGSNGLSVGTIVAFATILLAPVGVLMYAILAYRSERIDKSSRP